MKKKPPNVIEFRVSDTGKGMTQNQLSELFFNNHSKTSTIRDTDYNPLGLGLGLSISNNLVIIFNRSILNLNLG